MATEAQIDAEIDMLVSLARKGLRLTYEERSEDGLEDDRVAHWLVLPVFEATDVEGDAVEGVRIWSTASSHLMKLGIIGEALSTMVGRD